jgi:hypothetical protein
MYREKIGGESDWDWAIRDLKTEKGLVIVVGTLTTHRRGGGGVRVREGVGCAPAIVNGGGDMEGAVVKATERAFEQACELFGDNTEADE